MHDWLDLNKFNLISIIQKHLTFKQNEQNLLLITCKFNCPPPPPPSIAGCMAVSLLEHN